MADVVKITFLMELVKMIDLVTPIEEDGAVSLH